MISKSGISFGIGVAMVGSWFLSQEAEATAIYVPLDYPSILEAVDAAVAGDTIMVSPGTWTEHDTRTYMFGGPVDVTANAFLKAGLTLVSETGPAQTVIDASVPSTGYRVGLFLMNQPGSNVVIDGFTLTTPVRGLEGNFSATLVVRNCRFVNCWDAIELDGCSLIMEDTEVLGCGEIGVSGKAVEGTLGASMELRRCVFEGNVDGAVGLYLNGYSGSFRSFDCTFLNNSGRLNGAIGISGWQFSNIIIENNLFVRNSSPPGFAGSAGAGGITEGYGVIRFNVFAYDTVRAPSSGGGLKASRFTGEVSNNTFIGCHCDPPYGGAAIAASSGGGLVFEHNIVAHSTGGVATYLNSSQNTNIIPDCNDFWNNEGGNYAGGLPPWPQAPTDFFLDPMFCDIGAMDFTVSQESPCAPQSPQGCGLVGAFGVGCGTISVEEKSWGAIKALYR